nr:hypothetical protein [uncultured Hyphomonas sp.]
MTEAEARAAADRFLEDQDKKGHRMVFIEAKRSLRHPGEWNVIYDLFSPQGTLIDGPVIVIVDEQDAEAHLMEGP